MTAGTVVAIRGRVGQPRVPGQRLLRDVIELELRRCSRQARRSGVSSQSRNRTLHHRVAVGSGRDNHLAGSVKDEGSTLRADGLASQQSNESVVALSVYL